MNKPASRPVERGADAESVTHATVSMALGALGALTRSWPVDGPAWVRLKRSSKISWARWAGTSPV